jgi:hypothetical protein
MLIDISKELADHYDMVRRAAQDAIDDEESSSNGKAALLNATTSLLKELAKIQQDVYSSSLIAQLKSSIVEALEEASPELKERVLEILERRLSQLS